MAKLLDQRGAIRLLTADNWTRTRGGKHAVKMEKPGRRPITLPHHHGQPYGKGLSAAIVRQAGLNPTKDGRCSSRSSSIRTERSTGPRSPSSRDASRQAER
ncbi:MAG: type II toxin-antitoxin system HicA family toxin [Solirubrobacteraceae bacterium]